MVRETSARPRGARVLVPAKTTSSILPPRRDFAPCSPITQDRASTMLDLPDPFGPTTQVMPGSSRSVVAEANDLNPRSVRVFRYTCPHLPRICRTELPVLPAPQPLRAVLPAPQPLRAGRPVVRLTGEPYPDRLRQRGLPEISR